VKAVRAHDHEKVAAELAFVTTAVAFKGHVADILLGT